MGGLFSSLNSSLDALRAFDTALQVSQNNVSNSSTPGYARQVATLNRCRSTRRPDRAGGVQAGPTQSTQNEYADQAVRTQYSLQGNYTAQSNCPGFDPIPVRRHRSDRRDWRIEQSVPKLLGMERDP